MKVYISCDMEGISGVVNPDQVGENREEYNRFRKLMTLEVNAAVEGALEGGATEILINDAHGSMDNLLVEEIHPRAWLVSGSPKPLEMMEGIDGSFDMVFFIGYHSMAGTHAGVMDHTYMGRVVYNVYLNGKLMGELGLNSALAGTFGVPVGLVTGDDKVVEEARRLLGEIQTVVVKEAVGRYSARCLPPAEARERIKKAATAALKQGGKLFRPEGPFTIRVEFINSAYADLAELIPEAKRIDARTLEFTHHDYLTVYKAFRAMVGLARMALK
ncbi:MAG: M55 family metallopeptidase [Anaerolineae bacterium]|nr:M55 family metallopeptidase [Anaerolineae bacterium]MDW8101494.1 M55 family metallopeptidase [Anaerolineae bacterium]